MSPHFNNFRLLLCYICISRSTLLFLNYPLLLAFSTLLSISSSTSSSCNKSKELTMLTPMLLRFSSLIFSRTSLVVPLSIINLLLVGFYFAMTTLPFMNLFCICTVSCLSFLFNLLLIFLPLLPFLV